MAGNFLEQIKKAREAKTSELEQEPTEARPIEEMNDAELEQAERAARRRLLDLQHQEVRERELARVSASGRSPATPEASLADVLQELQRKKRRTWR
jgi:CBS domain containing-hemolysin-like protein